jgi:hypothetical protein
MRRVLARQLRDASCVPTTVPSFTVVIIVAVKPDIAPTVEHALVIAYRHVWQPLVARRVQRGASAVDAAEDVARVAPAIPLPGPGAELVAARRERGGGGRGAREGG